MHFSECFKKIQHLNYVMQFFFPFIWILITSYCTLFWTRTVLESNIHCNAQNVIHLFTFLVKITAFGIACVSCLRVLQLPPRWFWNHASGSPLCYPAFSLFFQIKQIKHTNQYKTYVLSLWFWKKSSKETNHSDSHLKPTYIKDRISNGCLFSWSGLVINSWMLRLIRTK